MLFLLIKLENHEKLNKVDTLINISQSQKDDGLTVSIDMTPKSTIYCKNNLVKEPLNLNGGFSTAKNWKKALNKGESKCSNTSKSEFSQRNIQKGCSFESAVNGLVQKNSNYTYEYSANEYRKKDDKLESSEEMGKDNLKQFIVKTSEEKEEFKKNDGKIEKIEGKEETKKNNN